MENKQYFRVGMFMIVGSILIVIGIILFGGGKFFRKKILLETYFDQTVQGLDVGAPLKFQGVTIGNVSEIGFVFNDYNTELPYILVKADLFPEKIGRPRRLDGDFDDVERLRKAIKEDIKSGLRIELASQGITGIAFLNMLYVEPEKYEMLEIDWTPHRERFYIPSKPGTITLLTQALEKISDQLSQVQFKEIGDRLEELLTALSRVEYEDMDEKLRALLVSLDKTTRDFRRFGVSQQAGIDQIINEIQDVSDDIAEITNVARRKPSWILFGEPPPRKSME